MGKLLKKIADRFGYEPYGIEYSQAAVRRAEKAVQLHIDLLKDNGYRIIQIPRFKGFNLWKAKIFRPGLLPLHNLEIMEEERMHILLVKFDVKEIFCKEYGTLKLRFN